MSLLDTNYQDQRLTPSQKKKIKPAIQAGVMNYMPSEMVTVPKIAKSSPDTPTAKLAYITPEEQDILIDLNLYGSLDGKPNRGPGGIPSLEGDFGSPTGSTYSGGSAGEDGGSFTGGGSGGGTGNTTGGNSGGNGGRRDPRELGFDPREAQKSKQYSGVTPTDRDGRIIEQYEGTTEMGNVGVVPDYDNNQKKSLLQTGVDNVVDFIAGGGILGNVLGGISSFSEGLQEKAMTFSLNKRLSDIYEDNPDFEDYESLDQIPGEIGAKVRDLESDLQGVRDGTFKQSDFTAKYGSGDATNPLDASFNPNLLSDRDRRNLQNLFTPELAYAVSGQTPQDSMVNQYFNNMNMNQGSPLSSNLQTDYNNAKNSINSILGILPPSQQFGYSADPYGGLMASNLTTNPFNIDYLRRLGLI